MLRRHFLPALGAGLLNAQASRPNILFVTADDLGLMLSCYGEKRIDTPNLDKLAASGVRFTTAYVVQASCSPSRSGMFTGLYPHSNGQYGLANGGFTLHAPLHDATIPNILKKGGYRTGIIGKLHVEPESAFAWDHADKTSETTRKVRDVARKAGDFIGGAGRDPFFLMVNFSDPHAFRVPDRPTEWYFPPQVDGLPERPITPSAGTLFPFQGIDTPEQRERTANYYNAVLRLDHGVGLLMDELQKSGRDRDTMVVFCGDHGPPFARGKTTCYEWGLRVPFVVRWPGVTKPAMSRAMVSTTDIAPTIYDAAGIRPPIATHGRSLLRVLQRPSASWRRYLAAEFHFHGAAVFYPRRAIRDFRYKLIHNLRAGSAKPSTGIDGDRAFVLSRDARYDGTPARQAFDTFADPPEFELYDLQADPYELDNVAGDPEQADTLVRMKRALLAWRKETADPFLDPNMVRKYSEYRAPTVG